MHLSSSIRSDEHLPPVADVFSLQRQLNRYAEDFAALMADYDALKRNHDPALDRRVESRIEKLAHFDPLTGLPNRALFSDRLDREIAHAKRNHRGVALMFLDLNKFKLVNDNHGHDVGDAMLVDFGRRLQAQVRDSDTVARLGGDEFVIIAPNLSSAADIELFAAKIFAALEAPLLVNGQALQILTSIGAAIFPEHGESAEELLRNADSAMYEAKRASGSGLHVFNDVLAATRNQKLELEAALRHALARNELSLVYQPQIGMQSGEVIAVEALLRWDSPTLGCIDPQRFIPLAESSGLIIPIGDWVLRAACEQQVKWQREGQPPVRMAVNVSSRQVMERDFSARVLSIMNETGIMPGMLELELNESALLSSRQLGVDGLHKLRDYGVRIAVDDFGSSHSAVSYLYQLPVDTLKVDCSYITDPNLDSARYRITRAILLMAGTLGLATVAEGVETELQAETLARQQCTQLQGFYLARPQSADDVAKAFALFNPA